MTAACILAQEPEDGAGSNPMCQAFNYLSSLWYYRISFKAKPWDYYNIDPWHSS